MTLARWRRAVVAALRRGVRGHTLRGVLAASTRGLGVAAAVALVPLLGGCIPIGVRVQNMLSAALG